MGKQVAALREKIGTPMYPKPRYNVSECLILLDETRKTFYAKVNRGRYRRKSKAGARNRGAKIDSGNGLRHA